MVIFCSTTVPADVVPLNIGNVQQATQSVQGVPVSLCGGRKAHVKKQTEMKQYNNVVVGLNRTLFQTN